MKALDDLKKIAENFQNVSSIATVQHELFSIHDSLSNYYERYEFVRDELEVKKSLTKNLRKETEELHKELEKKSKK